FEPQTSSRLKLTTVDMLELPFDDQSFDVVASYQALEHVPRPRRALEEMLRVVRPGGAIVVVSPNLISLLSPLAGVFRHTWRNRPATTIFIRTQEMPRHPWGNTIPENLAATAQNAARVVWKLVYSSPQFTMREPDLKPPFHSDND